MYYLKIVLVIQTIITLHEAKLTCKRSGRSDMICSGGNTDNVLKRGKVSDDSHTTGITLRNCRLTDMYLESFEALPALEYLDLSVNKLSVFKLGVFDGNHQVKLLNLSHNLITGFPLGLFDEKPNLEVIDLKGNQLDSLELGIFDKLEKLRHVDLSSNSIKGLNFNAYIFDRSQHVEYMDFSRNDMSQSPENILHAFRSLNFLNLDRCRLMEIPMFALSQNLKTMKHLMLSTNIINKIDDPAVFANLESLEIINLADNVIEDINENCFKTLKNLKIIVLRNNRIKHLPETIFKNIPKLMNIDLSHNVIESVPVDAFRGTSLKNLNLSANKFTYLQDNFCLELRNSGARLSKFFFSQNPWQCACLRDVVNEVKRLDIQYNKGKYNGDEPVCVTTTEFNCKRHTNFNDLYVEMYDNLWNQSERED